MQLKDIPNEHVVELAQRWADDPENTPGVIKALVAEGIPEKLALRKVEKLSDGVILEYGVSPYYAWPVRPADYNEFEKYIDFMKLQETELLVGKWARMVIDYKWIAEAHVTSLAKFDAAWEHLLKQPGIVGKVTDEVYGRQWMFYREQYRKVVLPPLRSIWSRA